MSYLNKLKSSLESTAQEQALLDEETDTLLTLGEGNDLSTNEINQPDVDELEEVFDEVSNKVTEIEEDVTDYERAVAVIEQVEAAQTLTPSTESEKQLTQLLSRTASQSLGIETIVSLEDSKWDQVKKFINKAIDWIVEKWKQLKVLLGKLLGWLPKQFEDVIDWLESVPNDIIDDLIERVYKDDSSKYAIVNARLGNPSPRILPNLDNNLQNIRKLYTDIFKQNKDDKEAYIQGLNNKLQNFKFSTLTHIYTFSVIEGRLQYSKKEGDLSKRKFNAQYLREFKEVFKDFSKLKLFNSAELSVGFGISKLVEKAVSTDKEDISLARLKAINASKLTSVMSTAINETLVSIRFYINVIKKLRNTYKDEGGKDIPKLA